MASKWAVAHRTWPASLIAAASTRCRKQRYVSREDAMAVMHDLKTHGGENRKVANRLHAYFCWPCGYWHVGHDNR